VAHKAPREGQQKTTLTVERTCLDCQTSTATEPATYNKGDRKMSNKMNVIQGLKALVNMGVDLRAYGAQVDSGVVVIPASLDGIHEAIMNACEELAQAGEGENAKEVLLAYIDSATAM
jgi:hypothetical protein